MLFIHRLTGQAVLTLGLFALICAAQAARADYTATIDPTTQYQTFEGWGTSLAWFAHVIGGAPDSIRNNVADLIFDPNKGLGLTVARYNIGGGENPVYHSLQFRAAVPGYEPSAGVYDWTQDANQRWFLQAAIARGVNQMEAFSNSPPYWMTNSGSVTGSTNGSSDNLNPAYYDAFAEYLATVAQHFATGGIVFRDVEPFNEPIASWWQFGGGQEGCHFDRSTQNTLVNKLGAMLAGLRSVSSVAASDENSIDDAVLSLGALDGGALGYLSKVNTHSYNGIRRLGLWNNANSAGKAHWMSEYGDGDGSGLTMSEQILSDMRQMHPTAWVYWQALDDVSAPGWGMLYSNLNNPTNYSYTINEKYYVMANYSKFIRPGDKLIFCDDGQSLAAYNQATQTLVIVTTNNTNADTTVTYNLSAFNSISGAVTPYRTSANENLAALAPFQVSKSGFSAVAKASSVTTYVISGVSYQPTVAMSINDSAVGTGMNQFHYSGLWNQVSGIAGAYQGDEHWSLTPNASYTLQFSGTQILLYASTGRDHGIVAMSIDGGPEEEVDLYSNLRTDNALVYASATLPNGAHTLKVRATERRNSNASKVTRLYADRADIISGQSVLTTGYYELVSRNSGDVMDISGSSTSAGTQAIQWYDYGGSSQFWKIAAHGAYFNFINFNSGDYLDVSGASTAGGADVIQWYGNGGQNQDWSLAYDNGLYYKVYNRNSGMVLNVNADSTSDGASLIQWYDNNAWNSQWALIRVR